MASECARATVLLSRDVWITKRQPRMRLEPHRLVFIDETSVNTKMVRLRAAVSAATDCAWMRRSDIGERRPSSPGFDASG
jgi:hypothetical protein